MSCSCRWSAGGHGCTIFFSSSLPLCSTWPALHHGIFRSCLHSRPRQIESTITLGKTISTGESGGVIDLPPVVDAVVEISQDRVFVSFCLQEPADTLVDLVLFSSPSTHEFLFILSAYFCQRIAQLISPIFVPQEEERWQFGFILEHVFDGFSAAHCDQIAHGVGEDPAGKFLEVNAAGIF